MPRFNILDLASIASPETVAEYLRAAAELYEQSSIDLAATWQDPRAGSVWLKIAKILKQSADRIEKTVDRHFSR